MEDFLFRLQALLFTTIINGLLCFGAWRLASTVTFSDRKTAEPRERLLVMLALIPAGVLAVTLAAGAAGVLFRPVVTGAVAFLAFLSWFVTRRKQVNLFIGPLVVEMLLAIRRDRWLVVALIPGLFSIVMLMSWAAVRPSFGFDPLNYHLPVIAGIFRTGSFQPLHFPPYFEAFPWFTLNGDLFGLWTMLSTGDASLLAWANMPLFLLLGWSLYGFARDTLPSRAAAAALTSVLLTVPAFFVLLADAYVEIPLWAFMFASLRLIVVSSRNSNHAGLFALAGALCGAMIGTKLTGIPMALVLLAAWLVTTEFRPVGRSLRNLGLFLLLVAGFGGYFYVRNLILTGTPVYPFPLSVGGIDIFDGDAEHAARVGGTTIRRFLIPVVFSGDLFKALVGTRVPPNSSWGLGVTGPAFLLAGILLCFSVFKAARSQAGQRLHPSRLGPVFLGASLLAVIVYVNLPWCAPYLFGNVRFVYPAVPFAALAVISLPSVARVRKWFFVVCCLVMQLLSFLVASVPLTIPGLIVSAIVAGGFVLLAGAVRFPRFRRFAGLIPVGAVMAAVVASIFLRVPQVQAYRSPGFSSGPIMWASERADCLKHLDMALPEGRFALTMARGAPHAWFIFPLTGDRFQREPVYVDISSEGGSGALKSADSLPGWPGADKGMWLDGIKASGVKALVILNDREDVEIGRTPVEFSWADSEPGIFTPLYRGDFCTVYRVSGQGEDG